MNTNKTVYLFIMLLILSSPMIFSKPPVIDIKLSKNVYLDSEPIWLEINVNIDNGRLRKNHR